MDKCVVLTKQGCGYVIKAPKGHVLAGPKYGISDDNAILWAKAWISSFDGWTLKVEYESTTRDKLPKKAK